MIVEWVSGKNILYSHTQTLICPVNTVGVMGNGLAKYFSLKIKRLLFHYQRACRTKELTTDKPWIFKSSPQLWVMCFATKKDWRNPSELEWIESGLKYIAENYEQLGITSLSIPMIGCGKGQLVWEDVKPLIIKYLDPVKLPVYVYVD